MYALFFGHRCSIEKDDRAVSFKRECQGYRISLRDQDTWLATVPRFERHLFH